MGPRICRAQEVAEITDRLYHDALDTYNKEIFPLKLECKKLNSELIGMEPVSSEMGID